IDGKPVAEFMYTRSNGPPVALCIARTGAEPAGVEVDRRGDLELASWQTEGYTFVIAGIMSAAEAAAVAEQARSQPEHLGDFPHGGLIPARRNAMKAATNGGGSA